MRGTVEAVGSSPRHSMSKPSRLAISLIAGVGIDGDVHAGATVPDDPRVPNLRQVHLLPAELLEALAGDGFALRPGEVGENVLVRGLDLAKLPLGTRLGLGTDAEVELTGVRTPCRQLEGIAEGLMRALLVRGPDGRLVPRAGVMAVVRRGGQVQPGDPVEVVLPETPHRPLPPL
jgi:MOSC domain-containing protein YiiM